MAIIQNSAIIQKIVDELELSPATEKIPTELAEKILPVFQVNAEKLTISPSIATVVKHAETPATILAAVIKVYDVPATGKFYLTNVVLQMHVGAGAGGLVGDVHIDITIDGVATRIACLRADYNVKYQDSVVLNLQNPILLDAGSDINFDCTDLVDGVDMHGSAVIVGYTEV